MNHLYDQYRQTSVQTAPPGQLVVMLYDGLIRFLERARAAMESEKNASDLISRSQDIILELLSSLNYGVGEMATNQAKLYNFWLQWLVQAQLRQDPARIQQVLTMVRELREAWETVAQSRAQAAPGEAGSVPSAG